MNPSDFIHPEDAVALEALKAIPGLAKIVKSVMDIGVEQFQTGLNLATKIKLSPRQLPHLYNILPPICNQLGIMEPDFFLEMNPEPNAYAFGDTQTAITITSGLVELMTKEELRAVVAHECGHIACHHMLYHTIAAILANATGFVETLSSLAAPIKYALFYWERKSELSCDRAAAYVAGPQVAASMLARLAGGSKMVTAGLDLAEWAEQADQYDALCKRGFWNKTLQTYAVLNQNHPFTSVRIREMLLWIDSDDYKQLIASNKHTCPNCGNEVLDSWAFCQHCGHKL